MYGKHICASKAMTVGYSCSKTEKNNLWTQQLNATLCGDSVLFPLVFLLSSCCSEELFVFECYRVKLWARQFIWDAEDKGYSSLDVGKVSCLNNLHPPLCCSFGLPGFLLLSEALHKTVCRYTNFIQIIHGDIQPTSRDEKLSFTVVNKVENILLYIFIIFYTTLTTYIVWFIYYSLFIYPSIYQVY